MKITKVYIDLDGILANFSGQFSSDYGKVARTESLLREIYNEEVLQAINRWRFYRFPCPCKDSKELFCKMFDEYGEKCEILSVVPNLGVDALQMIHDKKKWVRENISADVNANIIFREEAPIYCTGRGTVLISCSDENIAVWEEIGGTGILYTKSKELLKELRILEGEDRSIKAVRKEQEKLDAMIEEAIQKQKAIIGERAEGGFDISCVVPDYGRKAANEAFREIKEFCDAQEIDIAEHDEIYRTVYPAFGIRVEKVPIRYYPRMQYKLGSMYKFTGIEGAEKLFYDEDPVGKTFEFRLMEKIGIEDTYISYFFKVERELPFDDDQAAEEGWKSYEGNGKPEGYRWSDGTIRVRESDGEIQSIAVQKMYYRVMEPIWKKASPYPVDGYTWLGVNEDIPDDFELAENEYYYDETINPPRGLHYKEQGILAYDDLDEIVILGITDYMAEKVVIPREINGKPVTILDKECFKNGKSFLREVILPDTIREIGDRAFLGCIRLIKPDIPASVERIGKDLYKDTDRAPSLFEL